MYPPPAASRQLAELVPFPTLQSAADAPELWIRQWDSLIGSAACASVHTHVAAHGYGLPDGAPALCEPPARNYRPGQPDFTSPATASCFQALAKTWPPFTFRIRAPSATIPDAGGDSRRLSASHRVNCRLNVRSVGDRLSAISEAGSPRLSRESATPSATGKRLVGDYR